MENRGNFIKATFIGGIFFLIPLGIMVVMVGKLTGVMKTVASKLTPFIPVETPHGAFVLNLLALAVILGLCFLAGLVALRATAKKLSAKLESVMLETVPGYSFVKGFADNIWQSDERAVRRFASCSFLANTNKRRSPMHRIRRTIISGTLFLAVVLTAVPLPATEKPAVDPASPNPAMEQVMRMANFLAQLKQFSVTLESGYDVVQESGQKIEFGERRKLTVARPDRLRVDVERSDGDKSMTVFDGKSVTVFAPKPNMYATAEMPGDIDGAIIHFVRDLHMRLPLALMFVTSLPRELEQRDLSADIVETSTPLWYSLCPYRGSWKRRGFPVLDIHGGRSSALQDHPHL